MPSLSSVRWGREGLLCEPVSIVAGRSLTGVAPVARRAAVEAIGNSPGKSWFRGRIAVAPGDGSVPGPVGQQSCRLVLSDWCSQFRDELGQRSITGAQLCLHEHGGFRRGIVGGVDHHLIEDHHVARSDRVLPPQLH